MDDKMINLLEKNLDDINKNINLEFQNIIDSEESLSNLLKNVLILITDSLIIINNLGMNTCLNIAKIIVFLVTINNIIEHSSVIIESRKIKKNYNGLCKKRDCLKDELEVYKRIKQKEEKIKYLKDLKEKLETSYKYGFNKEKVEKYYKNNNLNKLEKKGFSKEEIAYIDERIKEERLNKVLDLKLPINNKSNYE